MVEKISEKGRDPRRARPYPLPGGPIQAAAERVDLRFQIVQAAVVIEHEVTAGTIKCAVRLGVDPGFCRVLGQAVARHDARDARLTPGDHADNRVTGAVQAGLEQRGRVIEDAPDALFCQLVKLLFTRLPDVRTGDVVELFQARRVGEYNLGKFWAVQRALWGQDVPKCAMQCTDERTAGHAQAAVHRVCVHPAKAALREQGGSRALARARAAGQSIDLHGLTPQ